MREIEIGVQMEFGQFIFSGISVCCVAEKHFRTYRIHDIGHLFSLYGKIHISLTLINLI